jgi:hypothetical protein
MGLTWFRHAAMGTGGRIGHLQDGTMRQNSRLFRLSASVAISALLCQAMLPVALAQPPATPQPQVVTPEQTQLDPPDRVGRIAVATGAVSFRTSADTEWSAATANYPVSSGNAFWTEPSGRAELEISASRIDLSGQTEFDVTSLNDGGLQATVQQGELYLHLAQLAPNEEWSVQTPRGKLRLAQSGRYGIVAGTTEQPTQITVLEGSATLTGPGVSLMIAANQTATVEGDGPFQSTVGPEARDAFLAARLAAERPPPRMPPQVASRLSSMPDIDDLAGSGEWGEAPDYGEVWYPPVAAGWVPYQNGQWAYVAPWGWTWIDSAPWGFVPFHYGRWAHIGSRWGWVPGEAHRAERHVYAPALVAFLGLAAGGAIAAGRVGWVPLAPGEPFRPWYRASDGYVRQINAGHVRDPAELRNSATTFVNRNGATSVPEAVMLGSRPVRSAAQPMSATTFAASRPVIGRQPITPTSATLGVTPAVARQLNLAAGFAPRRAAPGPVVQAQDPGTANGPPRLVGPRPGEAGVPGPAGMGRGPGGPLPLVVPGTRPAGIPGAGLPGAQTVPVPGGLRPEGRPPGQLESGRPPGFSPLPTPGGRPAGAPGLYDGRPPSVIGGRPGLYEGRPPQAPEVVPQPGPIPGQGSGLHLPGVERPGRELLPTGRAPGLREAPPHFDAPAPPPRIETPRFVPPPPRVEAPPTFPAPSPRIEAPRLTPPPPRVQAPPPPPAPPRIEAPRFTPPPPHVEVPRVAAPPPPHIEPPRPAAPPRQEPPQQRRPGDR